MAPHPNKYTAFLSKVDAQGFDQSKCWAWLGAGKGNGYGNVNVRGKTIPAHRISYELFVGTIPSGSDICHSCDNRWCVNPDHLWAGTHSENMADCNSKGRASGGCRKHLNERQIQEIRRRLNAGVPPSRIAESLDINYATVTAIQSGRSYVGIN